MNNMVEISDCGFSFVLYIIRNKRGFVNRGWRGQSGQAHFNFLVSGVLMGAATLCAPMCSGFCRFPLHIVCIPRSVYMPEKIFKHQREYVFPGI